MSTEKKQKKPKSTAKFISCTCGESFFRNEREWREHVAIGMPYINVNNYKQAKELQDKYKTKHTMVKNNDN